MAFLPEETVAVYYETVKTSDNQLTAPGSVNHRVYDPSNVERIAYDASRLVTIEAGKYRYYFDIPSVVLPGKWHINIQAVLGVGAETENKVSNVYFDVEEV